MAGAPEWGRRGRLARPGSQTASLARAAALGVRERRGGQPRSRLATKERGAGVAHVRCLPPRAAGTVPGALRGRGRRQLAARRTRARCALTEPGRSSRGAPRRSAGRAPPRRAPRARAPRGPRRVPCKAGFCGIPGAAGVAAAAAVPRLPGPARPAGSLPSLPGRLQGAVTSLGEAGAFTTSLLAPSREAGGEAGARAWWLRGGGLCRGRLAQTSGDRCLQRITHRWSLGSDCPPPTHTSSALRSLARSLALPKGFRAVRRQKGSKERKRQRPGAPLVVELQGPLLTCTPLGGKLGDRREREVGNGQGPFGAPLSGLKFWNPKKKSLPPPPNSLSQKYKPTQLGSVTLGCLDALQSTEIAYPTSSHCSQPASASFPPPLPSLSPSLSLLTPSPNHLFH